MSGTVTLARSRGTIVAHRVAGAHLFTSSNRGSLGGSVGASSTTRLHHAGVRRQELANVGA